MWVAVRRRRRRRQSQDGRDRRGSQAGLGRHRRHVARDARADRPRCRRKVRGRPRACRPLHRRTDCRLPRAPPPKRARPPTSGARPRSRPTTRSRRPRPRPPTCRSPRPNAPSTATVTSWHEAMTAVAAGQGTMGGTVGGDVDTSRRPRAPRCRRPTKRGATYGPVVNVSEANPARHRAGLCEARLPGTGRHGLAGPALHGRGTRAGTVRAERVRAPFAPAAAGSPSTTPSTSPAAPRPSPARWPIEIMRTVRAGTQLGTA